MFVDFKPNKDPPPTRTWSQGFPHAPSQLSLGMRRQRRPVGGAQRIAQWNKRRRRGTQVVSWA